ncbi:AAA-like domain-containing protein [Planktothrix sp. FACHB-1365]|uniref:AAA-like domain-containing protein n=1 Tax=Planktothrix sp. FACHB-1365 TaxID=2692855 RepID=UPI00168396AB|nr:AAA-like domain-containing protein [Planktothrix sp. FACHB-1365]MBD2481883.1 AAA-like domain-containing protein [Planktothrix sp. FACHB-1365]
MNFEYQTSGSLEYKHPSYIKRQADDDLYNALKEGQFCYVLNARQMGKSSLQVQILNRLKPEVKCVPIDLTDIGTNSTQDQWYFSLIEQIVRVLELYDLDHEQWWNHRKSISNNLRFYQFIEDVILVHIPNKIVIFLDEIDTTLKLERDLTDNFFALIRSFYNKRSLNPQYKRLTFCLLGVAAASDLIQDSLRTPFNIGREIDLKGFKDEHEAAPLAVGFQHIFEHPQQILAEILNWTGGQPFLTQFFCQLFVKQWQNGECTVEEVANYILENWENLDDQSHFKTIQHRLLEEYHERKNELLDLYQQILLAPDYKISAQDSPDEIKLRLTGLVVKENSHLRVYNPLYANIFNLKWLESQLPQLRPFNQQYQDWLASKRQDTTQLLIGDDLEEALQWAKQQNHLSSVYIDFLNASRDYDRQQLKQAKEKATKIIQLAQKGTKIELAGIQTLRLFDTTTYQPQILRGAIQAGEDLQQLQATWRELVQDYPELLKQTPAASLILTLQQILSHIRQWRQLTCEVWAVAFSPGGEFLATASDDNTAKLWDLQGEELITFTGHSDSVWDVAFSPGGEYLATASDDKTAKLWSLQGEELITFTGHSERLMALAFSPGGEFLATASRDNTAKLWNLQGEELITFAGHSNWVTGVAFSPGGEYLVTASLDNTAKLWNLQGEELITFTDDYCVMGVAFSPGGEYLVTASEDNTAKLWNLQGEELITFTGHSGWVTAVAFSPGGEFLVTASVDKTAKLWNLQGELLITFTGHSDRVRAVAFSPDGDYLATASVDKTAKLWNLHGEPLITFMGHFDWVTAVAFSPGGEFLVTASEDKTAKLWNLHGEPLITFTGHSDTVRGVAFSPGGEYLVTASEDKTAKLWNLQGEELITFTGHSSLVTAVTFSSGGEFLATASHDKTAKLWDLQGKELINLTGHSDWVTAVAFSPGGEYLATASWDNTAKLWNLQGEELITFAGHSNRVWAVAFSPGGEYLATTSHDKTAKLWNLQGEELITFAGHSDWVTAVAFSPGGEFLATASDDNTIKVWDLQGNLLADFRGYKGNLLEGEPDFIELESSVNCVCFSPDGKQIVAGYGDGTVRFWRFESLEELIARGKAWLGVEGRE